MRRRFAEKPENFSETMKRLLSYLKNDVILIIFAAITLLLPH